jgi:hypothetical protein
MTCKQVQNIFPDIIKGDTFTGLKMTFYDGVGEDKTPMDLTGVSIVIAFKKGAGQNAVFAFKTLDATITIPDPESGEIFLQPRLMEYPAMTYVFDVELTFLSGTVRTYLKDSWRVCQDV